MPVSPNLVGAKLVPHDAMHTLALPLFGSVSSTCTCLLPDPASRAAAPTDPVDHRLERDLAHLRRPGLQLTHVLETHVHAEHITSAGKLCARTGAVSAAPGACGIAPARLQLGDGAAVRFGAAETIAALHTPGHTAGGMRCLWRGKLCTGDTLLIDGCGRTDVQGGSAAALYDSVTTRLFTLPGATRVWKGHDYHGQSVSTIGWERAHNARLAGRDRDAFSALMAQPDLPKPTLLDGAVPANRNLGLPHGV